MPKALTFAALLLAAGLGACGFQMQGTLTVPPEMERTYVDAEDRFSPFYRALRNDLMAAGVELVDNAADASAIFVISYDFTDQRVLSVSARNVPTEYEVFYTVEYSMQSGEKTLLELQDMTLTRDYTYDATQVLGKEKEATIIRDALVQDLVRIVLKQISAQ